MMTIERVKQSHGETEGWLRIQRRLPLEKIVKGTVRHMNATPKITMIFSRDLAKKPAFN